MSEHDDKHEDRKGGWAAGCLVVAAVALPLYVLSIGPAWWLAKRGWIPDALGYLYHPLAMLAATFDPIKRVLNWYLEFWQ